MAGLVTAVVGSASPLALFINRCLLRPNCPERGLWIDCMVGSAVKVSTGFRLGTINQLLAVDSASARSFRAAVRDENGLWSEFGATQSASISNFTPGGAEVSIGSAAAVDIDMRSPGVEFPDLSRGSGKMRIFRTLVGQGESFTDETRTSRYSKGRAAFHVLFDSLDQWQLLMLHRFWRAVNGPQRAFFFDWVPPENGGRLTAGAKRYLVKFRDAKLSSQLISQNMAEMEFVLVEVVEDPEGGDV